jgi:hypothetical protein
MPAPDEDSALAAIAARSEMRVVLLGCAPYLSLYYLGYGDWNSCPSPVEQATLWKYWGERHGAEVVCLGVHGLEGVAARPPDTLPELERLVTEFGLYSADSLTEGILFLAGALFRSHGWSVWWD